MAASAQTFYYHGSSPGTASSDVTGLTVRHQLADRDTQDALYPIPYPSTGLSFGWRKSSIINFFTSPASNISNLRWFLSSTPPTGISFFARVQAAGVYVQASASDQNGISGFTDNSTDQSNNNAVNYTSASPLTVNSGTVITNPNTGVGSQVFVETQLAVTTSYTGGPGPITSFQITYRYSET